MAYLKKIFGSPAGLIAFTLLTILTVWRIALLYVPNHDYSVQVWSASYQILALWGVIWGFYYSRQWGGFKSVIGRANIAFALGLCAQLFGQTTFSYFFYKGIDIPYPSIADIGFFGSIPFYIYGTLLLGKAAGSKVSLKNYGNKIQAFLIPFVLLALSYYVFLREYAIDSSQPLRTFLDFGYPLGQAIYVSIAILVYTLSRKTLGGMMKMPTLLFLISLVFQYISDYIFLYQSSLGTYIGGGYVDYLYALSYFLMAISLIGFGVIFKQIKNTQ